jgi:hypothetical protein
MIKKILKKILNFNGVAILIGLLGSLSSILTIFITQWDLQISLKWFIFSIFITLTIFLILTKVILGLNEEIRIKRINTFSVLRYIKESTIFLIQPSEMLGYLAMVSIFYLDDTFEIELGKGYVKNIQENYIQIQLINIVEEFKINHEDVLQKVENNDNSILKKIIIKSYVSYSK